MSVDPWLAECHSDHLKHREIWIKQRALVYNSSWEQRESHRCMFCNWVHKLNSNLLCQFESDEWNGFQYTVLESVLVRSVCVSTGMRKRICWSSVFVYMSLYVSTFTLDASGGSGNSATVLSILSNHWSRSCDCLRYWYHWGAMARALCFLTSRRSWTRTR